MKHDDTVVLYNILHTQQKQSNDSGLCKLLGFGALRMAQKPSAESPQIMGIKW